MLKREKILEQKGGFLNLENKGNREGEIEREGRKRSLELRFSHDLSVQRRSSVSLIRP